MKINIKGGDIELTPSLVQYIEEKVGSLARFFREEEDDGGEARSRAAMEAFVEVARTTKHHRHGEVFRARINLRVDGKQLRAETSDWDIRVAIDAAREEMKRELVKEKDIQSTKLKRGARSLKKLLSISPLARFRRKKR